MTKLFGMLALTSVIAAAAAVAAQPARAQQAAITNIDIELSRTAGKGPFDVRAEVNNPNDFAVKDVHVHCVMQDSKGNRLVAYDSTILAIFPPRQKIVVPRLDVGAWPDQAVKATCTSSSAQRV